MADLKVIGVLSADYLKNKEILVQKSEEKKKKNTFILKHYIQCRALILSCDSLSKKKNKKKQEG